mgnify:CR=1 FL=1
MNNTYLEFVEFMPFEALLIHSYLCKQQTYKQHTFFLRPPCPRPRHLPELTPRPEDTLGEAISPFTIL